MKNGFVNKLEKNEEILWYGVSDNSKSNKQYGRFLLFFVILLLFWILIIIGINGKQISIFNIFIFLIILSILTIFLIYGLVYNIFLKHEKKNNEYFTTNKRIAIYNYKSGFRIENIFNIEHIGIVREKNNYGDILFHFCSNNLIDQIKTGMSFDGVENPRKIVELISHINNRVHIYDDRPTLMGKKI